RLRLLLLRVPVRRAAISEGRQLRLTRQDGQVHLLRRRPRSRRQQGGVREVRRQPARRRQAAAVRRDVLDQVAARRRWRRHRPDLQGAGVAARLRLRRLGLADGLSRDDRHLKRTVKGQKVRKRRRAMARFSGAIRTIAGVLAVFCVMAFAAPAPSMAQVNPNAAAVKEQQLLDQLKMIQGRGTIPDAKSYVIEHPAGRDWRVFHNITLRWIGGIAILGMLALLIVFYLWRGMVKIESGRSGRSIVRFNVFERFVHWMTATCFIILAITGLNITFGRPLFVSSFG